MKRAITQEEKSERKKIHSNNKKGTGPNKFDDLCNAAYKVFENQKELEKKIAAQDNQWDSYSAGSFGVATTDQLAKDAKTSFEFYICGWLQYYDQIVRNNAIDHTIYFKWNKNEVVVYISPKPGSQKDPIKSPPAKSFSDPQSPKAPPPPNP